MAQKPITACAPRYRCVDRNGRTICVGDRIRFQHCTGPYGQTRISEGVVDREHYEYGAIGSATLHYDATARVMRGRHTHSDYEHGHETWIEVIV
jgi:hypothetical protein